MVLCKQNNDELQTISLTRDGSSSLVGLECSEIHQGYAANSYEMERIEKCIASVITNQNPPSPMKLSLRESPDFI
jgi:hypothetical protein